MPNIYEIVYIERKGKMGTAQDSTQGKLPTYFKLMPNIYEIVYIERKEYWEQAKVSWNIHENGDFKLVVLWEWILVHPWTAT